MKFLRQLIDEIFMPFLIIGSILGVAWFMVWVVGKLIRIQGY